VTIEITESTLMHNVSLVGDHLARLGAAGYRVSIDDFGTGYSSLSYLQDLPIQEVKIDRSFVSALCGPDNGRSTAIVASVLAIARALGLEAVAEGVEAEDLLTWLQANGCSQAQGFLFDRPLSVEEFEAGYLSEKWRAAG
jgi:EAL domain-containing protein (putative c-di-GMP-specific phosphodiesterase class I)